MAEMNPKIFRAYDIRGIYPEEINTNLAYLIGRALVKFLKEKTNKEKLNIVVSRDGRNSSPELFEAVKKGVLAEGGNVVDIGLQPTTIAYFTVWRYSYDGGAQITASHNPPEFNGFKLIQQEAQLIAGNTGMDRIKELVLAMAENEPAETKGAIGQVVSKEVLNDYLDFNLSQFDLAKIKGFKVVADSANGAGGTLMRELAKRAPFKVINLFDEVDGNFPNHLPDPCKFETLKQLSERVKAENADLGLGLDADGDRLFLVDEKGEVVVSSQTFSLIVEEILSKSPGEKFVYNIFMSRTIPELIKEKGGQGFMVRVGFTFLKEKMKQEKAIFGGEQTGHFAHKEHGFIEVPLFVLLAALTAMAEKNKTLSELASPFKKYYGTDININLEVNNKEKALKLLEEKYQDQGSVSYLDGVRIDFDDWWFCARPSNTEDLIRIMMEAPDKEFYEQKVKELTEIIEKAK